jgi:CheY-like chemotaxis protein
MNLAEDLDMVHADASQVEQIIMNLVVNARDAMATGGALTIETENVDLDHDYAASHVAVEPGPYVLMAISDTGVGMSREVQARIFEPFFTTKGQGKGTGLGLATVFGIVKQSKGNVWVYSEEGRGTTFKVYLPAMPEERAASLARTVAEPLEGAGETILVVEDEELVRNSAVRILLRAGYTVLDAGDAATAEALVEQHADEIRLLLTDVVMPNVSGPELASRLAARLPALRVVYMSGYTDDSIVHHGVLDKDVALIQKPFTRSTLLAGVSKALSSERLD